MIELKDNSTGSVFGPIIVMIDASRLGHSLATALKDRPHGIPVQPNRSLPLRPPPPIPKKNSPIAQAMSPEKAARNNGNCGKNFTKGNSKDGYLRKDGATSAGVAGMNFYDSKGEEDNSNDKSLDDFHQKIPKDLVKHRHTKSMDNDGSDEIIHAAKRRKSFEYGAISRDSDSCKKRKVSNFEWDGFSAKVVQKEKKIRGSYKKKRKSSIAEENPDLFRKEKFHRGMNFVAVNPSARLETVSQSDFQSQSFERVQSSDLPTIFKYRNLESTSPLLANRNPSDCIPKRSQRRQTGSNKLILPKPPIIPKCPIAIPIELAHAMNQGDSRNSNVSNVGINETQILRNKIGNSAHTANQCHSMKPKINITPQTIDEIENTLPSMPSLEDLMQPDDQQEKLTLHRNQIDCNQAEENLARDLMPMAEARVQQTPLGDLASEINSSDAKEPIQGYTHSINNYNLNKPHESILNLTTMLKIKIPGRSPELIILQAPHVMSNGTADGIANDSPVEATAPVSLFSGIQPAQEEPKKIEEPKQIDISSELRGYRKQIHWECQASREKTFQEKNSVEIDFPIEFPLVTDHQQQYEDLSGKDQPQYLLQHKSPVEFEIRIKDTCDLPNTEEPVQKFGEEELTGEKAQEMTKGPSPRPKVEEIVRCRKNRLNLKLQKLYEEEAHLKSKMSQTSDPSRLTRLQQKINCAEKKIENTQKYLNKLVSLENPGLSASPAPSRIQVRQDLVQKIPSPESGERILQSPLQPSNETDKPLPAQSPPVLSPIVITISETDSASSGEETDTTDGKSPEGVGADVHTNVEVKFNDTYKPENVAESTVITGHPLPDDKVENAALNLNAETMNNNVEYLNKNLFPLTEDVSPSVNTASINIPPLIRDPINYSLKDLNGVSNQKSPSIPYSTPNLNLPPDKFDKEQSKPNNNCLPCIRANVTAGIDGMAKFDADNSIPSAVSDLRTPKTIRRTAILQNTNVHPVSNYPVHRPEYRTTGNGSSMFSRDNGGANINLSSPLQGHSAVPLSPSYYNNMTAQGYSMPAEPSPSHQTMQWHNQHPPAKPSMQFTPDQDVPLRPSILAAQLLKSQAQEAAKIASSLKLSSLAQSEDATRTNPAKHVSSRVLTAQFPSLAKWVAQRTEESTIRKPVDNSTTDRTEYKTTGSDMYKMTATAIDSAHPLNPGNTIHWAPQRPCPEQPRPIPNYPPQRSIPQPYRSDYLPNPQIPQNFRNGSANYPGPKVLKPYPTNPHYPAQSGPQNTRNTEHFGSQTFHGQQNVPQYHHPTPSTVPLVSGNYQSQGNSSHLLNPLGIMHQQYLQQPPSYAQTVFSQWHSGNEYYKSYGSPQYNDYIGQIKPVDNNLAGYRPRNENIPQMQPSQNVITRHSHHQNPPNAKIVSPMYNMPEKLNPVIRDRRNAEPLDLGRAYVTSHLERIHKSSDRLSGLKCSRCGMPGPKFNCFGCETAFYCNEQCQAQHWSTHFIECPKKMPKLKKVS